MSTQPLPVAVFALACCFAALGPARADSFVSSASSAGSASSGSVSDSIEGSSDSSSGEREVAQGEYRVDAVAADPRRPGGVRLTLRPTDPARAAAAGFVLRVPLAALGDRPLGVGELVEARHRVYGLEFRRGEPRQAFFLALADDWRHEFGSRPVGL